MAGCTAILTQKDVPRRAINATLTHIVVREGPASAGPNAFPGEILELKNKVKKKIRKDMNMY